MKIDDVGFHLDGDAWEAQMDAAVAGLTGDHAYRAMEELAFLAEDATKERYVPVLTGRLSNSITGRPERDTDGVGFALRTNLVVYAARQEFEDSYHHPNRGPTGERGAHYILRGMLYVAGHADTVLLDLHNRLWGETENG